MICTMNMPFQNAWEAMCLLQKKINLATFALDILNSDSSRKQLYGIRLVHSFLQKERIKARLLPKITTSTKTMARLINMLDWKNPSDAKNRLFAAKVVAEVAKSVRVITIPGTVQVVSALLDYGHRNKTENPLLDRDAEQEEICGLISSVESREAEVNDAVHANLLDAQIRSTEEVGTANKQSSWVLMRRWERMLDYWSTPKEEPPIDQDLLPALGMSIIHNLACCSDSNCKEIMNEISLIPKIIGFTESDRANNDTEQSVLVMSSLRVLHKLTNIEGTIGVRLRHRLTDSEISHGYWKTTGAAKNNLNLWQASSETLPLMETQERKLDTLKVSLTS